MQNRKQMSFIRLVKLLNNYVMSKKDIDWSPKVEIIKDYLTYVNLHKNDNL